MGGLCLLQILVPKLQPGCQKHLGAERGTEAGAAAPSTHLDSQDLLSARAMERKADDQQSVVKLVAAFEEHW